MDSGASSVKFSVDFRFLYSDVIFKERNNGHIVKVLKNCFINFLFIISYGSPWKCIYDDTIYFNINYCNVSPFTYALKLILDRIFNIVYLSIVFNRTLWAIYFWSSYFLFYFSDSDILKTLNSSIFYLSNSSLILIAESFVPSND